MADRACGLTRRFFELARRSPEAPALLGGEGEVLATRGRLARHAAALAEELSSLVRAGDPVVLSLPNSPTLVTAFLALRLLGARVALVDATAPAEELRRCADAVGSTRLVTGHERFPDGGTASCAGGGVAVVPHSPQRRPGIPSGTAVLKLTSGSTGMPRAVAVTARQLAADMVQIMRTMEFGANDVTLAAIPLTHSYGIGSCLVPLLLAGTPLALAGAQLPAALAAALAAAGVTHLPAVPAMVRALGGLRDLPPLPRLRVCLSAGAPLAPTDAAAFHAATGHKVHAFYGSSECGGITYDRSSEPVSRAGMVGTPLERVRLELIDADGEAVPAGTPGRVVVISRSVAITTLGGDDHAPRPGGGRFLTDDLAILDERGRLILTERIAETLNVAGKKVHPEEVRRVLVAAPGVRDAVVVGLPDPHRGQLVAALVAREAGTATTVPALLSWCRSRLAPHKIPRRLVIVDELPTTPRGKLAHEGVAALLREPPATVEPR